MAYKTIFVFLLLGSCYAAPVDDPIRIDLPVFDQPETNSDIFLVKPLKPENYPGGDPPKENEAAGQHFVSYKLQAATNLGDTINGKANAYHEGGILSAPITTRETVLQETEGYASKALSFKENIQGFMAGIFQPKPIVDTISESEKYGNTGDKFYTAGKALVGGAESLSNFVNSVLEVPGAIFKSITQSATQKLNNLGGKLIGL